MEAWRDKMKIKKERLLQIIQEELEADAKNPQLLNEFFDVGDWFVKIFHSIPEGALQKFQEWIAAKVMNLVGIKRGFAYDNFLNYFGNLSPQDWKELLAGEGACIKDTQKLAETFTEYVLESIPRALGVTMDGWFWGTIRESIGVALLPQLNKSIATNICNLSFGKIVADEFGISSDAGPQELDEAQKRIFKKFGADVLILEEEEKWIQDAEKDIKKRGTEGVCTGDKFGSESCPPGSKRYNLAKTFRKMAKDK